MQFNKMIVMLPVMLLARKLDSEDPSTVYWLRVAYAIIQTVCVLLVAYTYVQASAIKDNRVVYVPPPPAPFADPNAKKKYTETKYGAHVLSNARSLLGSTLFGVALTIGLHYYKGMVMGLAIQTIMAPINLAENPLVKALFTGGGIKLQGRIFEEKIASELTPDDEVVDDSGNPVVRNAVAAGAAGSKDAAPGAAASKKPFEEILLDTWDAGSKADLSELMSAIDKKNCNYQTKDDKWSPLMILAGLGAPGTASAIRQVIELGGKPSVQDKEGWNALHWSAFHGSVESAKLLRQDYVELLSVKDKEGYTPIDTARKEKNDQVAQLFEEALAAAESKKDK